MQTTTSADGTAIAFDKFGDGPPIIMVVGAFNDRSTTSRWRGRSSGASRSSTTTAEAEATAVTPRRTRSSARSRTSAR
jgi:hypothetical protein